MSREDLVAGVTLRVVMVIKSAISAGTDPGCSPSAGLKGMWLPRRSHVFNSFPPRNAAPGSVQRKDACHIWPSVGRQCFKIDA